jgi:transcriptional regulator with XRE-family HTH domain
MGKFLELGTKIKLARKVKGWSLRDLEERSGISNPYLSQLERGLVENPSIWKILKLAEVFGLTINDLVDGAQ